MAKPRASPVMSSRLAFSSQTWSLGPSAVPVSHRKARTQLARPKSLLPIPYPVARMVQGGMGPKEAAKERSSAAPVGVHSSPGTWLM